MEHTLRNRIGRVLEGAVFVGVLTIVALAALPDRARWEWVFESAVFGLTVLWGVKAWLTNSTIPRAHLLLLPLLALVVFALIQSLPIWRSGGPGVMNRAVSVAPFETVRFALRLLAITLMLGLLLRIESSATKLRILIYTIVGIALVSALFGIDSASIDQATEAGFGQFQNRNHFALLMEMSLGLVMGLMVGGRSRTKRLPVYILSGGILLVALLLTHSRGAVLGLMVEVLVFLFLYSKLKPSHPSLEDDDRRGLTRPMTAANKVALASLLLLGLAASVVLIGGDETINHFESTPAEFTAAEGGRPKILRPQIWQATLKLIVDHPLVGVGFAGYSVAIPPYLPSSGGFVPQQAHNDYLELLASGGFIGGLLFAWFLAALVRETRKQLLYDSRNARAVKYGALAGLSAVAVHSLFDFGLHITINALVCAALVTVVVSGVGERRHSAGLAA